MKNKFIEMSLIISISILFFISTVAPMVNGYNNETRDIEQISKNIVFNNVNKHNYPEEYSGEKFNFIKHKNDVNSDDLSFQKKAVSQFINKGSAGDSPEIVEDPTDSPWPMYCHDAKHTGRSPYSTANTIGAEKWRYKMTGWGIGSPVINNEGIIYAAAKYLHAFYPNGTLKWIYDDWYGGIHYTAPAIDENGTIYVGIAYNSFNSKDFYAINPEGTVKWIFLIGDNVFSSPVIGDDGTIYFGAGLHFYALYPNGTLKWDYTAEDFFWGSSPAIDDNGIVYCGAHDDNLYAWYPNNGSVKWIFDAGTWIHGSPTIGEDGVIYLAADNGLYALYSNNGTMKWHNNIGPIWGSSTLDENGNIYAGTWDKRFYAIYPNGEVKWIYDAPGRIWFGTSAAISAEGIIYFGTTWMDGGEGAFIALNDDGTEKWRDSYGWYESSPSIGIDGTVYVVSTNSDEVKADLHAFGELDPDAPEAPSIVGETNGEAGVEYEYTFSTMDPNDDDVYYYIEWGDGEFTDWIGPYDSGEEVIISYTWDEKGTYTIKARAKDTDNLWGPWGELEVTMPVNQPVQYPLIQWLLERFPNTFPIFRSLIGLK